MEPIEAVNKEAFAAYVQKYADAFPSNIPYILRYWNEAKTNWFHSFGDRLTIEKPILYTENEEDIKNKIYEFTWASKEYQEIYNLLTLKYPSNNIYILLSTGVLARNHYNGPTFTVGSIKVQEGCKPMPTIHKILRQLDYPEERFERFRIAHSQVLNTSHIYGTLVLSIDPLDYITMSDNDCGWDSCMCWVDHNGEYHGGTVEMMNSPCVLMAYIKSDKSYYPCGDQYLFSNKKWRQLIIADEDIILGNRQYPYSCEEAETEALRWVKEIMETTMGCAFSDELASLHNHSSKNPYDVYLDINTDVMYNDIYDTRMGYLSETFLDSCAELTDYRIERNISGPRNCMSCGELIDIDAPSEWVTCVHCNDAVVCACCGAYVSDEDDFFSNSLGQCFCRDCIESSDITICSCCDEPFLDDDIHPIEVDFEDDPDYEDVRTACLCPNCYRGVPFGNFGEANKYGVYNYHQFTGIGQDFIDELRL